MVKNDYQRGFIPILILILIFGAAALGTVFIGNAYKKSEEKKEIATPEVSTLSATPKTNTTQKSKSPSIPNPTSGQRKTTPIPTLKSTGSFYTSPSPTPTTATYKSPTVTPQVDDPKNPRKDVFLGN